MPTHDYVIDNQTAPNFRADLNNALQAIVSNNSNSSSPSVTYANMMWYDTTNNLLRMRNEDNDAWITLGTLDQVADTFSPAGLIIASQAEAEAGTDNTKLMTSLRVSQAIPAKLNATGAAPIYACRAFVYFNGSNGNIIYARNVSGVTRTAEGKYTVSLDIDAPSTSYAALVTSEATRGRMSTLEGTRTAGSFQLVTTNASFNYEDAITVAAAAFW